MDNNQAKELISSLFTQAFDRQRYEHFLRNLLNHFEPRSGHYTGNYIPDAFKEHVNQYWRIGKYADPEGEELDLLVVEVSSFAKLERARSSLRNFAVNRLKQFEKDASLIAFYARDDGGEDWRFSFVKIEHEAFRDAKGKVKLKQELTPARRYSYLVGVHENSHTAAKQLLSILAMDYADPRIEEIEAAFSVEKVSNEFFEQYKQLFLNLAGHLKKQPFFQRGSEEETDRSVSRFAKKLLGQIVFLYFLQKKGWLGVPENGKWGQGSKRFMRERFDLVAQNGGNYFRDFLQYLFYEALARERKGRNPDYYPRFDCKIPFLNGGLFEAEYDWENEIIDLPNELFHNDVKNKAGDKGTGILDVFDRYNFTIKEDEPLEKEVAIDPEMLGKVFENMLEVTERKSKGAFYTPREIVHYMCQESLIYYLDSTLGSKVQAEDLETLIRKGHVALENDQRVLKKGKETETYRFQLPGSVRKHAKEIDRALADIKICDPAIGSGAFSVGLLHEIVTARLALAPHSGNAMTAYDLKRHAIRESIYGVDIDASAIDIARLRLWLSLIVDEERYDTIEPLPNLDYKIVRGDSLIGAPGDALRDLKIEAEIEELKTEFFNETDSKKKQALRSKIDNKVKKLLSSISEWIGSQIDFDFKLYFSEVWHKKGGFDVVIGNPPYVQIQKFSGQQIQKDWESQRYETFAKTGDIYCLFYEKGYCVLRDGGILAFITSNKWMRAAYGKKLRKFLHDKTEIEQLIDFGDSPIFSEATTYTNILLFRKATGNSQVKVWDLSSAYRTGNALEQMLEAHGQSMPVFSAEGYILLEPRLAAIKKRIEEVGTPLRDWDVAIYRGILTGFNEAFIIDGKKKDELIATDPKSAEIIKPILRGRDIKRYRVDFADLWLIATFPALNLNIDEYPAVRDYLKSFGRKLHQTGEVIGKDENGRPIRSRKKTGNKWFETQDQIAYYKEFEKEKIVWAEIVFDSAFYHDTTGIYPEATAFVLTGERTKYLTAMLNSQLLTFSFRAFYAGGDLRGNTFRYKKAFLMNLPVAVPSKQLQTTIEIFVDYIQLTVQNDKNLQSAFFEQLIDGLVYELYFPDEIKAAGKEILPHLGKLEPINSPPLLGGVPEGRGGQESSSKEKLAIIQREFNRLYDPNHPVRNNLETLDSVEVVRTIREALKK